MSTVQGLQEILIGHLGNKRVWDAFYHFAPPDILEPGKYRSTLEYIRLTKTLKNLFEPVNFPLRSTHYPARVVGWIGLALNSFMSVISLRYVICFTPLFGLFWLVSLSILIIVGSLEFDPENITYHSVLGRHRIRWDEIQEIEQEPSVGWLLLYGDNKRLGIPGPNMWSGKSREIMRLYYETKILEMDVEITESFWVNFRFWSKNTRVRNDKGNKLT